MTIAIAERYVTDLLSLIQPRFSSCPFFIGDDVHSLQYAITLVNTPHNIESTKNDHALDANIVLQILNKRLKSCIDSNHVLLLNNHFNSDKIKLYDPTTI